MSTSADSGPHQGVAELQAENACLRQQLEASEGRVRGLNDQLQHRVRNLLAVLHGISRRTAELSRSAEDYMLHWDGRLAAITRAENVALRNAAGGVDLQELIAEELLANTAQEGEQVEIAGPSVALAGRAVEAVWLAVHELAVNSVKFGTLSAGSGRISVCWDVIVDGEGKMVQLEWREDAPVKAGPHRRGFGTEVIGQMLAYELGGRGSLDLAAEEVVCSISLPVDGEFVSTSAVPAPWQTPARADLEPGNAAQGGKKGRQH